MAHERPHGRIAVASALVASAAALVISLFLTWSRPSGEIIVFGALDRIDLSFETTGWERCSLSPA